MSIQSSINQAVNGMMSMIMPMSLLKEQGKVKQIKAEQEVLKKSNEELKTSNDELMTSNEDLKKSLAKVAFSSDYNDLKNKPEIPDSEDFATKSYVTETITKIVSDGTINLDGYAKTLDVNKSLNKKVDKVDGYSLVSDVEIDINPADLQIDVYRSGGAGGIR